MAYDELAMPPDDADEEESFQEGRGRSARKREVRTFDAMALELMELSDDRCKGLPVTEALRRSLHEAKTTSSKAARRRHIRHLAGLLRDSDAEVLAIRNFLAGNAYTAVLGDESYRDLEALRTGLCSVDTFEESLKTAWEELPYLDLPLVKRLATQLQQQHDDKSFRALFKELRRATDESERDEDQREDGEV